MCWETFYSFTCHVNKTFIYLLNLYKLSRPPLQCRLLLRGSDGDSACAMQDGRSEWRSPLEPPLEPPLERDLVWISRRSAPLWIVARLELLHTTSALHRDMKVTITPHFICPVKQIRDQWIGHRTYLLNTLLIRRIFNVTVNWMTLSTIYFHFRWGDPESCNVCLVCH